MGWFHGGPRNAWGHMLKGGLAPPFLCRFRWKQRYLSARAQTKNEVVCVSWHGKAGSGDITIEAGDDAAMVKGWCGAYAKHTF